MSVVEDEKLRSVMNDLNREGAINFTRCAVVDCYWITGGVCETTNIPRERLLYRGCLKARGEVIVEVVNEHLTGG